jgi:hypothetical protein
VEKRLQVAQPFSFVIILSFHCTRSNAIDKMALRHEKENQ